MQQQQQQQQFDQYKSAEKSDTKCVCFVDALSGCSYSGENEFEWLHFDDTKVKCLTSGEFNRKIADSTYDSPYILFYVKDQIRA